MSEHERPMFLVTLTPTRPTFPGDATDAELSLVREHFERLVANTGEDAAVRVRLAGRTLEDESPTGIVILEAADLAAARAFMSGDAAVAGGVMNCEVRAWGVAVGGLA